MKRLRTPFLAFGVLYAICSMFEDVFLVYFNARYFARISGGFSLNCSHPPVPFQPSPFPLPFALLLVLVISSSFSPFPLVVFRYSLMVKQLIFEDLFLGLSLHENVRVFSLYCSQPPSLFPDVFSAKFGPVGSRPFLLPQSI